MMYLKLHQQCIAAKAFTGDPGNMDFVFGHSLHFEYF